MHHARILRSASAAYRRVKLWHHPARTAVGVWAVPLLHFVAVRPKRAIDARCAARFLPTHNWRFPIRDFVPAGPPASFRSNLTA